MFGEIKTFSVISPITLIQIIFIVVVVNHHIQVARYVFDNWSRSGVEDTMFEAKDWKKIRGQNQGPAFQVQTLSRPRAELVEAKAKDQGQNFKKSYGRQTLTVFKRESVRHCISLSFSWKFKNGSF